jgi:poly [ADP-ribose] polymerase
MSGKSNALQGTEFFIAGTLTNPANFEAREIIIAHGGRISESLGRNVRFVLSSEDMADVYHNTYKLQFFPTFKEQIEQAHMWNIPIVTFEFVAQSVAKGSLIPHQQYLIKALVVDLESKFKINSSVPSDLPPKVQDLIKTLFDEKEMDRSLVDMGLDVRKIKLIDQTKISSAYKVLQEIEAKLQPAVGQTPQQHQSELQTLSNKFFDLIPHSGATSPIKTVESIKDKSALLGALTDIEIAQRLMRQTDSTNLNMNPIDVNYRKLRAKIIELASYRAEYQLIKQMVENTQSKNFKWKVEVDDVFEVEREGEKERFRPFQKLPHHRLLWHGSRLPNYIGILSQGLRIAPPEAPVTGYFLGKGIYFADMVSVSSQYCKATKERPYGYLLLCDVALGRAFQCAHGKFVSKEDLEPAGFHSVKCWGTKGPDSGYDVQGFDGMMVSLGKEASTGVPVSELIHNEIVVYDPAQVNIRYIIKLNFKFPEGDDILNFFD